jgi:hypothetical protein
VITPTVTVSNDLVTSVSWVYCNPVTGAVLNPFPSSVKTVHLYLFSNSLGTLFNRDLPPSPNRCVLASPLPWSQVDYIATDYSDTVGNYYSLSYVK